MNYDIEGDYCTLKQSLAKECSSGLIEFYLIMFCDAVRLIHVHGNEDDSRKLLTNLNSN